MKKYLITICIFFALALTALEVNAATEFISIIDPDNGPGTSYSNLTTWAELDVNLTAADTLVFSFDPLTASGTISDNTGVTGQLSGATATLVHQASSTDANQILLESISGGPFQSGEQVYLTSGGASSTYVIVSDSGDSAIAVAKCRSTGGTADNQVVDIDGWTTSATNYLKIWTDPDDDYGRHHGVWDYSKYRLTVTSDMAIDINTEYVQVIGLEISTGGSNFDHGINVNYTGTGLTEIAYNIIRRVGPGNSLQGIYIDATGANSTGKVYNNIVYDFNTTTSYCISSSDIDLTTYMYNNTVYNCTIGLYKGGLAVIAVNNLVSSSTDAYNGVFSAGTDYNSTDEDDDIGQGSNNRKNQTFSFEDVRNNDLHLIQDDTGARNYGTSSVFWDTTSSIQFDIDGTARGGAFDIGADEVPVEYVSTICQATSTGGDCANLDYTRLFDWEAAVDSDLTPTSTRVFSGSITGILAENDTVGFYDGGTAIATGTVVATTSDQILLDGITGTTSPLILTSGTIAKKDANNYWTITGFGDDLGASPIAVAKIDGSWSASDTAAVTITDWTTDHDNYIRVYTTDTARHEGVWDESKYWLEVTDDAAIEILEDYAVIDGLQIKNISTGAGSGRSGIFSDNDADSGSEISVSNNIIRAVYDPSTNSGSGIVMSPNNDSAVSKVWNNIVYDFNISSANSGIYHSNGVIYLYNNTSINNFNGFKRGSGYDGGAVRNNISQCYRFDTSFEDYVDMSGLYSTSHNIASDNSSPDNDYDGLTVVFLNETNDDFHLSLNDIAAKDQGTDLSSDQYLNFSDDIDGHIRDVDGSGWDIGADETPHRIYRSVGYTGLDLKNAANVTISGSTATFSAGQPDNVGVGDVIQYGGSGYWALAFISGRTSSTTYSVQARDGSAPSATTSAAVSIYRAYQKLNDWETQSENSAIDASVDHLVNPSMDLVSSNTIMMVPCYASTTADDGSVDIQDWTTGINNYIMIYTPVDSNEVGEIQRHSGKWDADKYRMQNSWTGGSAPIDIRDENIRIDGLQIYNTGNSSSYGINFLIGNGGENYVSNCIIRGANNSGSYYGIVFTVIGTGASLKIWNNVIYDWRDGLWYDYGNVASVEIFNNTFVDNSTYGIYLQGSNLTKTIKNNIIQGISLGGNCSIAVSNLTSGNNISQDSTSPDTAFRNKTVTFWDAANDDFHLSPEDTAAIDAGTSTVSSLVTEDIDGKPIRTYDIGADDASVYFEPLVMSGGEGDFSTLATWENSVESDLTATSTAVFSIGAVTGTISDDVTLTGSTSGATATVVHASASSSQILLENISGIFLANESVGTGLGTTTLSDAGNPAIAVAKIDGAWGNADGNVDIDGNWETGKYNYIRVYTTDTARHNGVWSDSKYRIEATNDHGIEILEDYAKVDGVQIKLTLSSEKVGIRGGRSDLQPNGESEISNNIVKCDCSGGSYFYGLATRGQSDHIYKAYNNIIYGFASTNGWGMGISHYSAGNGYIYNNTIYNCDHGVEQLGYDTVTVINNITYANVGGFSTGGYWSAGSDYNISNHSSDAPGSNSKNDTTVTFRDAANEDFHLAYDDVYAFNAATSSVGGLFTDDIDGYARGIGDGLWDIGADELAPDFVSKIRSNFTNGDYVKLSTWEAAIDSDLTASTSMVFTVSNTGSYSTTTDDGQYVTFNGGATGTLMHINKDNLAYITDIRYPTATSTISTGSTTVDSTGNDFYLSDTGAQVGRAVAECYNDWPTGLSNNVTIDNWTTDSNHYVKIYAPAGQRHTGKAKLGSNYTGFALYSSATWQELIDSNEEYTEVDGVILDCKSYDNSDGYTADHTVSFTGNIIKNSVILNCDGVSGQGINMYKGNQFAVDNIIHNCAIGISLPNWADNIYLYNNTVSDCTTGIIKVGGDGAGPTVKNNLAYNNTTDYSFTTIDSIEYSVSSDGTADDFGGTGNRANQTFSFVNEANDDFHLAADDTGAFGYGTDLSADSNYPFSDDIDYEARGVGSSTLRSTQERWDIGADQAPEDFYSKIRDDFDSGDYVKLSTWEAAIDSDLTASTSRVFTVSGLGTYSTTTDDGTSVTFTGGASGTLMHISKDYLAYVTDIDYPDSIRAGTVTTAGADTFTISDTGIQVGRAIAECYNDWESGLSDQLSIEDWITDSNHYVKIYVPESERHLGKAGTGFQLISDANNAYTIKITGYQDFSVIEGLEINCNATPSNNRGCIDVFQYAAEVRINDNIIYDWNGRAGIRGQYAYSANKLYCYNNIFYYGDQTNEGAIYWVTNSSAYIYNNTFVTTDHACINAGTFGNLRAKNNICKNAAGTDGYTGTFHADSDYNASTDDSSTGGANDRINQTFAFIDESSDDYHLSKDDTGALGFGLDLSTDGVATVTIDIDGDYRIASSSLTHQSGESPSWDIGADQTSSYYVSRIRTGTNDDADFTTLTAWEDAVDSDLTASTTLVFWYYPASASGTIQDGAYIMGETSGASGTVMHVTATSGTHQLLVTNIDANNVNIHSRDAFIVGEKVYQVGATGNFVYLSSRGTPAIAVAEGYNDWPGGLNDRFVISGWTVDENNYVKVTVAPGNRHNGIAGAGFYMDPSTNQRVIEVNDDYTRIEWVEITDWGGTDYSAIRFSGTDQGLLKNTIIHDPKDNCPGLLVSASTNFVAYNLVVYNTSSYGGFRAMNLGTTAACYNCTSYNNTTGFYSYSNPTLTVKNCIAANNSNGDFRTWSGGTLVQEYNISSDSTAAGTGSLISQNADRDIQFIDSSVGNPNLRIMPESVAKDAGTDLSTIFATDITNTARPTNNLWDIGAFEAPQIIYRSVGNDSNDLAPASTTVTISGKAAAFNAALPDNVGVGDILQIGTGTPYRMAVISGRSSSTQFYAETWDGSEPTATTSAPVSIYRAHLELDDWEDHDEDINDVNPGIDDSIDDYVILFVDNLVASNTNMFVPCYASTSADDVSVTIDGWTTATSNYIRIYTPVDSDEVGASQRHSGIWSDSAYRMSLTDANGIITGGSGLNFYRLDGLQIAVNTTGTTYYTAIYLVPGSDDSVIVRISNNILAGQGTKYFRGIDDGNILSGDIYVWNNIVYGAIGGNNSVGMVMNDPLVNGYFYNNTLYNNDKGIYFEGAYGEAVNNAVFGIQDAGFDFGGAWYLLDHNATDDATGTNPVDISPAGIGTEQEAWAIAFTDYANYDFSVNYITSPLFNAGTTISLVTDDIAGNARPYHGVYEIGAFEFVQSQPKYRFQGHFELQGHFEFR